MQYLVTLTVDGIGDIGIFDTRKGGDNSIKVTMHRPGGMVPQKSFVTLPDYSTVTVSRVYERVRDHELVRALRTVAGKAFGTVTEQPLDTDGNAWGTPVTWRGRIGNIKPGDVDSNSTSVRMFDVDLEPETVV